MPIVTTKPCQEERGQAGIKARVSNAKPISALGVSAMHPLMHVSHIPFNSLMWQIIKAQPLSNLLKAAVPEWQGQVPLGFTCSACRLLPMGSQSLAKLFHASMASRNLTQLAARLTDT